MLYMNIVNMEAKILQQFNLASLTKNDRITRRDSDNVAVIADSDQKFKIEYYDFEGETAVPEF